MSGKTKIRLLICAACVTGLLFMIYGMLQPSASASAVGKAITCAQAATLWGGGCEEGCEVAADKCDYHDNPDCSAPINQNATCTICENNDNQEKCEDWGFCIGWLGTCQKCVVDTPFDCGTMSMGTCDEGTCDIDIADYDECGTNFRCHTEDQ